MERASRARKIAFGMLQIKLGDARGLTMEDGTVVKSDDTYSVSSPRRGRVFLTGQRSGTTILLEKYQDARLPERLRDAYATLSLAPGSRPLPFRPPQIPFLLHMLGVKCECGRC